MMQDFFLVVHINGNDMDETILHTFLSAPACTDMVNSKELERDVTTSAMMRELLP